MASEDNVLAVPETKKAIENTSHRAYSSVKTDQSKSSTIELLTSTHIWYIFSFFSNNLCLINVNNDDINKAMPAACTTSVSTPNSVIFNMIAMSDVSFLLVPFFSPE